MKSGFSETSPIPYDIGPARMLHSEVKFRMRPGWDIIL